jgi:hypothetical protein
MSGLTRSAARPSRLQALRHAGRAVAVAAAVVALTLPMADPAQAASLRARWNMDGLPTMVDSAGGDNNGKARNVTKAGSSIYRFNGRSSIVVVPDKSNLDPGSASITLTARVKFTERPAAGGTYDLIRKGVRSTAGGDYKMEIFGRSKSTAVAACTFKDSKGATAYARGTVNLAGKGFQTITCKKTSSSVQVTASGETVKTSRKLGSISNSSSLFVGAKGDGTDWFPGDMDFASVQIG